MDPSIRIALVITPHYYGKDIQEMIEDVVKKNGSEKNSEILNMYFIFGLRIDYQNN